MKGNYDDILSSRYKNVGANSPLPDIYKSLTPNHLSQKTKSANTYNSRMDFKPANTFLSIPQPLTVTLIATNNKLYYSAISAIPNAGIYKRPTDAQANQNLLESLISKVSGSNSSSTSTAKT